MKPLFMWAGGKKKLLKDYAPHLPEEFANYCEPFFGGGAMFTWAYDKQPNAHFYINDINEHIIGIYRAVRDDVELFCDYMDKYQETYMPLPAPGEPGGGRPAPRRGLGSLLRPAQRHQPVVLGAQQPGAAGEEALDQRR